MHAFVAINRRSKVRPLAVVVLAVSSFQLFIMLVIVNGLFSHLVSLSHRLLDITWLVGSHASC